MTRTLDDWALVDPEAPIEERRFRVAGTGHPVRVRREDFVDTVFDPRGFVWHVFDERTSG